MMSETEDELLLVKKFIELPFLLSVIEHDRKKILNSNIKFKEVYSGHLVGVQSRILHDLKELKIKMKRQMVYVIQKEEHLDRYIIKYKNNGYIHYMELARSKIKYDLMELMKLYEPKSLPNEGLDG